MKFKIHGIFLSLFFALVFCFSFSIETSAHEYTNSAGTTYTHGEDINISAADVDPASAEDMKKFVRHLANHLDQIQNDESLDETRQEKSWEIVIFANHAREIGTLNNGSDVYVIGVTPRGAITNHGLHQNLFGYRYDSSQDPLQTLLGDTVPKFSDTVDPVCATYDNNGSRVACAVRQDTPVGLITTIAGLHHGEDDYAQGPNCDDFTLGVTAKDVEDEADPVRKKERLKDYVQGVIGISTKLLADIGLEVAVELGIFDPLDPAAAAETNARFYEKAPCFRKEPDFRYGSIYSFIMDPTRGVVFLSGNDFTRNGLRIQLVDPDPTQYDGTHTEPNVLYAIHRTLTGTTPPEGMADPNEIEHGDSGFFRYHWADPLRPELNTPDYLERTPPATPGRALKESYVEAVDLLADSPVELPPGFKALFVFGSGIYPEEEEMMPEEMMPEEMMPEMPEMPEMMAEDDDDGCSIAATGNTPQSTLLNLFLIASVLFSAVFLRRRV